MAESILDMNEIICENLSMANELIELVDMYIEGDRKLYSLIKIIKQKIEIAMENADKSRNLISTERD